MPKALAPLALFALAGCVALPAGPDALATAHPEAASYDPAADAAGELDAALARAASDGTRVLLVKGANWCHDSRALAGWLETPRFRTLTDTAYEVVFVDVGQPQTGAGRNLDLARRFGHEQTGTPNLLVLTPEGVPVNADTAGSWRNAASRSEEAIYAELLELAHRPAG